MAAHDLRDDPSLLSALRLATDSVHRRIENRADIIARLSDPLRAPDMVSRYADLQMPADAVLMRHLGHIADLDMPARRRLHLWHDMSARGDRPEFPEPDGPEQAIGMLYVLEGATLGGRIIMRELESRCVDAAAFGFLDPYGSKAGRMWNDFLRVAEREAGTTRKQRETACKGALIAFRHAEMLFCGD